MNVQGTRRHRAPLSQWSSMEGAAEDLQVCSHVVRCLESDKSASPVSRLVFLLKVMPAVLTNSGKVAADKGTPCPYLLRRSTRSLPPRRSSGGGGGGGGRGRGHGRGVRVACLRIGGGRGRPSCQRKRDGPSQAHLTPGSYAARI